MKYWCHNSLGKLSLHFVVDSTLICQRVPLFSLWEMQKKILMIEILSSVFFYLHRLTHSNLNDTFICGWVVFVFAFCAYFICFVSIGEGFKYRPFFTYVKKLLFFQLFLTIFSSFRPNANSKANGDI